ncbi:hypothetical protein CFP71_32160 [Amycolatopsis thailandensis]|uniref:Intein C-terminal splicing domain-containing protein n=1 Tax=Amycolatopsis thailandensis TaxID=589330 RepID=A0A229RPE6_9PSEU|nr:polymorphic toxin-type HINT domain-containing protein [Amycolatopsis thailandensis]OXM48425.1 hypothetical protein CFP71_32160 [Amycolatopsis thailandensis]
MIVGDGQKHLVSIIVDLDGDAGSATGLIEATDGHPFWMEDQGRWLAAGKLKPGNQLHAVSGNPVTVVSVTPRTESRTAYNLSIDGIHAYYVLANTTAVLVHNTGPCGIPTAAEAAELVKKATPTGSALKAEPWHRAGSFVVDDISKKGTVFKIGSKDGRGDATLIQMPGELNGKPGRYEWIVRDGIMSHLMFIRGGTINGIAIKP